MQNTNIGLRTSIAISAIVVMWASAFAVIRFALLAFSPGELTLLRFLFASAAFGVIVALHRPPSLSCKDIPFIALLGLFGITFYHLALNYGEQRVTAGATSFLISSAPVFTALLATVMLLERLSLITWPGITIGILGVAIITIGKAGGIGLEPRAFIILFAAISSSLYTVLQKRHVARYPPLVFSVYTVWIGTIPLVVFMPTLFQTLPSAPVTAICAVAYLGILPGCIAYILWVYCLRELSASRLSVSSTLILFWQYSLPGSGLKKYLTSCHWLVV
jgi:drug/metabolite transporter (DMT)-like permease